MAKEDLLLQVEMGKLEIEPAKPRLENNCNNPFIHQKHERHNFSKTSVQRFKCSCTWPKRNLSPAIGKKKNNKILKEPVLKLLQHTENKDGSTDYEQSSKKLTSSQSLNPDILNLCALVDNCNQLRISTCAKANNEKNRESCNHTKWWKNDISHVRPAKTSVVETNQAGTCSQQALNPPCDVTIDELASYFETLVHIPKKMSSMAEMMYI